MNSPRSASSWWSVGAGAAPAIALLLLVCGFLPACAQDFTADAGWRDVSAAEYQQHLAALDVLVAACQTQRTTPGAAQGAAQKSGATKLDFPACDASQVGPNDRVQWPAGAASGPREVRYDWLRAALARAARKDSAAPQDILGAIPNPNRKTVTADQVLSDVRQRLSDDAKQVQLPAEPNPDYAAERQSLNAVLAQRAYQGVGEVSTMGRFQEWLANKLDKFFSGLIRFGSRSPWLVWLLWGLLVAGVSTLLVWLLMRIEWQSRAQLIPDLATGPAAPSAREWQLWLRDAQAEAAQGRWREAIHFVYWAAIARLESKRLWPADRARTPREYLALMAGSDARTPNLAALTRSFERTWYGGHAAAASDFNTALEQAAALGVAAE
jgi:hypothetical protein